MTVLKSTALRPQEIIKRLIGVYSNMNADVSALKAAYASTDPLKVFENGTYKTTAIALGSNPAVSSKPLLQPPTIVSGLIGTDGLNNPYTTINFEIDQQSVDGNAVVSFKVYRQQVPAEDLAQEVEAFSKSDFDKIAQKSTRSGKFSAEMKSAYTIDQFKQADVNKNTNLYVQQQTVNQQNLGTVNGNLPDYFVDPPPQVAQPVKLIATINYKDAQALAKLKQVYVQTQNKISLSYTDHTVSYGSGYIYTITSFCATSEESGPSETLQMVVLNLKPISPPKTCTVKQFTETAAKLNVTVDPGDLIKYVYVYKRNIQDLVFHPFDVAANANNGVIFTDYDLKYLNTYVYRVMLENVFGAVSEPFEVTLTCSGQNVVNKTRSNNLKLPIILASQDQNSDGIKLSMFPNDPRVLFYKLDRRNLTTGETVYSIPGNKSTIFWASNQFFVNHVTGSLVSGTLDKISSGSLPSQSDLIKFADPIEFVDNILVPDCLYQYRTSGYDLYGNSTGYGFAYLKARGKNVLRAPINFTAETLRETPYRVRLTWHDDNQASLADRDNATQQRYLELALQQSTLSKQQQNFVQQMVQDQDVSKIDLNALLAPYNIAKAQLDAIQTELSSLQTISNPLRFQLQRRLVGDQVYSSFPYTQNAFVIDEVATPDAIPFSVSAVSSSVSYQSSSLFSGTVSLSRSYGLPPFLQPQQVYQYRVAASTLDGATSDFSAPITVIASAQISDPVSFSASLLNPKVTPAVVHLQWDLDPLKNKPDHWRIERMVNVVTDTFRVIGNAYLDNSFYDRTAQTGQQYIYRIRSVSAAGDESATQTVSIST